MCRKLAISLSLKFCTVLFYTILIVLTSIFPASANDKVLSLSDIQNLLPDSTNVTNKVVYVDFWASWCIPCRVSFPWMESIERKYADSGLIFITINVDKETEAADKFLQDQNLNSVKLFDPKGELAELFELQVMPTSFVFDRKGKFVSKHEGFTKKESENYEKELSEIIHKGNETK